MSIRAVYFDLGGVLLRTEDRSPRTKLAESLGLDYNGIDKAVFASESSRHASTGVITEEQHWQNIVQSLNWPENKISAFYEAFFAGDRIDQSLVDFLRSLRPTIKVGLISNAWSGLREWINAQKFDNAFDDMTISAEFGVAKPDVRIYYHALENLGVRPEKSVFIDDMPANVEAAKSIGMHGFVFQRSEEVIADIKNLLAI